MVRGRLEAAFGQPNPSGDVICNASKKSLVGSKQSNRTKTDTGRRDEKSQALGRMVVKELCKIVPYVRNKGRP